MRDIEHRLRKVLLEENTIGEFHKEKAMTVNVESNLAVALELDSLDSIELVMAVEDEFGIEIKDEIAETFTTLQIASDWLEEQGIPNPEVRGYPVDQDPVIYLPVREERIEQRFAVVYANHLTLSGLDANLYTDKQEAQTFANVLNSRSVYAEVYQLVKV